jgi:hypothetical protein
VGILKLALIALELVFDDTPYITVPFPTPVEADVIDIEFTLTEEVQLHKVGDNTLNDETPLLDETDLLIGVMARVHSALTCLA